MTARRGEQDQTAWFKHEEANAWFRRNQAQLQRLGPSYGADFIESVLCSFRDEIGNVLEIGCGDGRKIEKMAEFFDAKGAGIDPSTEAVASGRNRLVQAGIGSVELLEGTADELPFDTGQFDLVHFGFSLYLVSRERIFRSIAEADRVLHAGGFMTIFDFDPLAMHKRAYAHKSGVFSYKARYADWLVATGHYHLVAKRSFSHAAADFSLDDDERLAVSVLYKEPEPYPVHG